MDWQQVTSLAVVAVTGYFFIRHQIRSRRKSRSRACGSDCGCGGADQEGPTRGTAREKITGNERIVGQGRETAAS
jgi:hypothetical protein